MHSTNLRKVGGSVMVIIPPVLLNMLGMKPGESVDISIQDERLVIDPKRRSGYTLNELLAKCNPHARRPKEDRSWTDDKPLGRELI